MGLRPEDFILNGSRSDAISASVEICERLGPEVLVHLCPDGVRVATLSQRAAKSEEEESAEFHEMIVARFGPGFSAHPGETISLTPNRERLQLFDVESGQSLSSARG